MGPLLCWGELERVDGWCEAVGTLLGPERTGEEGAVRFPFLFVSFSGHSCFPHLPAFPLWVCSVLAGMLRVVPVVV